MTRTWLVGVGWTVNLTIHAARTFVTHTHAVVATRTEHTRLALAVVNTLDRTSVVTTLRKPTTVALCAVCSAEISTTVTRAVGGTRIFISIAGLTRLTVELTHRVAALRVVVGRTLVTQWPVPIFLTGARRSIEHLARPVTTTHWQIGTARTFIAHYRIARTDVSLVACFTVCGRVVSRLAGAASERRTTLAPSDAALGAFLTSTTALYAVAATVIDDAPALLTCTVGTVNVVLARTVGATG